MERDELACIMKADIMTKSLEKKACDRCIRRDWGW